MLSLLTCVPLLVENAAGNKLLFPPRPLCYVLCLPLKSSRTPRQIILHCKCKHDRPAEKAGHDHQFDQSGIPPDVHKDQNNQRCLGKCDHQRNQRISAREDKIQVVKSGRVSKDRTHDQGAKYGDVGRDTDYMRFVLPVFMIVISHFFN